jgi:hypothetical protein
MSLIREIRQRQAELTALRELLENSLDDPFSKPLLASRVAEMEQEIAKMEQNPVATPETEIYFNGGAAVGSMALEAKFASKILASYPDIIINQYTAAYFGNVSTRGRRRGEGGSKLFLTALPRGSFGLQLSQPFKEEFFTAENLAKVMEQVAVLIEAAGQTDEAFDLASARFHSRVLKPLEGFFEALVHGHCQCRIHSGLQETSLSYGQVLAAYDRVAVAAEEEGEQDVRGVFGGNLMQSRTFELMPNIGPLIVGFLDADITDEQSQQWAHLTGQPVQARLRVTTITARTGRKKPRYELLDLEVITQRTT